MEKLSMVDHFSIINDPRIDRCKKHNLLDILVIAVCGVISSCETWVDIEEYGSTKVNWFKSFLELPNGIPSHDTFGRVFSLLDSQELQKAFYKWARTAFEDVESEVIALDAKMVNASHGASNNKRSIFGMVNAYATKAGISLAQMRTDYEKKDEKQGFRDLIDLLYLKGTIVTIDAGGCHANIANKIIDKEGDYFLALKRNQKSLLIQIQNLLKREDYEKDFFQEEQSKSHGRIEKRTCVAVNLSDHILQSLEKKCHQRKTPMWKGLRSACKITAQRTLNGEQSIQERYYLFSREADAKKMSELARGHWGIENRLHWVLDMAFDEDHCRTRRGYGGENFAVLRQIALNLLKSEKTSKRSIKGKRLKSGWDDNYLKKVITSQKNF